MPAKTPFPYQLIGAQFLASRNRALIGDEMGLGKTPQAILAAHTVGAERVLVICPASLKVNWRREFSAFLDTPPATLRIESYDKARDIWQELSSQMWDAIIFDEAHYLKNRDSKRTIAGLGKIAPCGRHVWFLTGTPMPNNPSELWTLVRAIDPTLILRQNGKPMGYWDFAYRYCHIVDNGFGQEIKGGRNMDELARLMAKIMIRRRKEEVLDLPPLMVSNVTVEAKFTAEMKKLEAEFGPQVRLALERLLGGDDDALAAVAPHVAKLRRLIGLTKAPVVADMVADMIEGNENKQVIVFAWHTDVVETIKDRLEKRGLKVATIVGGDSMVARQRAVDEFQAGRLDVVIGNIQAAGVGLTLTASDHEVFAESSWVPADNAQAMMRAHRIGQTRSVTVQFATLANSLDEAIQAACARKARDAAAVLDTKH